MTRALKIAYQFLFFAWCRVPMKSAGVMFKWRFECASVDDWLAYILARTLSVVAGRKEQGAAS